jgi:ABC-type polysaccharide/polyol phosphate export permease
MGQGTVITVQGGGQSLVRGLKRQSSVILAIIFKEIKVRSRTSKFGLMFVLIEPMIYIIAITMIRWLIRGRAEVDGLHVADLDPPRSRCVSDVHACRLEDSVGHRKQSRTARLSAGQTDRSAGRGLHPRDDADDARFEPGHLRHLVVFRPVPSLPRPLEAIGVIAALLAGCLGLALILGVYGTFYENIPRLMKFVNRPMIFISDVILPISMLPAAFREYLAWNPLLQFVQHFRLYAAGQRTIPEADLAYACLCSALVLGVGIIAYYANRYRLVQSR